MLLKFKIKLPQVATNLLLAVSSFHWSSHTQDKKNWPEPVPETAVTGQTGPDQFRFGSVSNRPKFKIEIWIQKNKKFSKKS